MSKYVDKQTMDDFLGDSVALTFAVISCRNSKQLEVVVQFAHRNCYHGR